MRSLFAALYKIAQNGPFSLLKHKQRGFSLLEMLVVLAIVGILASMVVSRYQSFIVQREVDTVARELAQSLESARITAQSYQKNIMVCPVTVEQLNSNLTACPSLSANAPWRGWVIIDANQGQVLMRSAAIPASVLVCAATSEAPDICDSSPSSPIRVMNALGQPSAATGNGIANQYTVRIAAAQSQNILGKKVTLAASGRVKYEDI